MSPVDGCIHLFTWVHTNEIINAMVAVLEWAVVRDRPLVVNCNVAVNWHGQGT